MSDETISRSRARTLRLASQAAAAVLVAVGVLLAVVGLPWLDGEGVAPVEYDRIVSEAMERHASPDRDADGTADPDSAALPTDWGAIEYSLMAVKNAPQPKVEETPDPKPDADPEETDPATQAGRTRFIGVISVGDEHKALLSAGGAQRVLGEGDSATLALQPGDQGEPPEVVVRSVTPEAVVLTENGNERRVERAERTGFSVSHGAIPGAEPRPATSPDADAKRAALDADEPINPDDYRRQDGTIDYESLREAARARARARQEARRERGEDDD